MKTKKLRSHCPVNFSLETFGDKWSLLIIRDIIFRGKRTYGDFLKSEEGFATNILASRLNHLEEEGIIRKVTDKEDARRSQFYLTEKGIDLIPILFQIAVWSEKYDPKSEARRIPRLLHLIKTEPDKIAKIAKEHIRSGAALFPKYLD